MNILSKNNSIIFSWIPNQIGINGNERADKVAKKSSWQTYLIQKFHSLILNQPLTNSCDNQIHNKLYQIQDTISEWPISYRRNKKEEMILSRLLIGHTHITYSCFLKRESTPICSMCKVPFILECILLNYSSFKRTHPKYYLKSNLKDLF